MSDPIRAMREAARKAVYDLMLGPPSIISAIADAALIAGLRATESTLTDWLADTIEREAQSTAETRARGQTRNDAP